MKKYIFPSLLIVTILFFAGVLPAAAQSQPELSLRLSRDFGYGSGTGKIQGTFSLTASGPDNLSRVAFYIDDQSMGEVSQAPFKLRFNTGDYPLGVHTLRAVGYTTTGEELRSNLIQADFVSGEEARQSTLKIIIPILVLTFGAVLLSALFPLLSRRGKKGSLPLGTPRSYGAMGGAICPKCGRPFSRHLWGLNMVVGKLDRCPHCGKWSIVRRATPDELRAAEEAELKEAKNMGQVPTISEEEKLRKELDDSRYRDL